MLSGDVRTQRIALIGGGWISGYHLAALDRLGRGRVVCVASGSLETASAVARPRSAAAYATTDLEQMLDEHAPDAAIVAVPPSVAPGVLELLVARRIPFLTEKPLAATDAEAPARVAAMVADRRLVAAVGYHLRGLPALADVRAALAGRQIHLVAARWFCPTPPPAWWRREVTGGGQVVEQATHFYDLARFLVGEARVAGAVSTQDVPFEPPGVDLVDATSAIVRFDSGAIGTFANSRRLAAPIVELEIACADLLVTIRKLEPLQSTWEISLDEGGAVRTLPPGRDPYEVQAEAFLDAVAANDPGRVLSTYADALLTDRLTRSVVAATGRSG